MAFTFLLWTLFILLVTAAATFGISFIIVFFIKGLSRPDTALRGALRVLRYAIRVFTAVSAFLSAPAIMCWLTGRFLGDLKEDETINIPDRDRKKMELLPKTLLIAGLALGGLLLNISFISGVYKGNIKLNAPISGTQVSAHRGASYSAPENTKYAFEKAISRYGPAFLSIKLIPSPLYSHKANKALTVGNIQKSILFKIHLNGNRRVYSQT